MSSTMDLFTDRFKYDRRISTYLQATIFVNKKQQGPLQRIQKPPKKLQTPSFRNNNLRVHHKIRKSLSKTSVVTSGYLRRRKRRRRPTIIFKAYETRDNPKLDKTEQWLHGGGFTGTGRVARRVDGIYRDAAGVGGACVRKLCIKHAFVCHLTGTYLIDEQFDASEFIRAPDWG